MSLLYTRDCIIALGKLVFVGFISLLGTNSAYSAVIGTYSISNENTNIIYTEPQGRTIAHTINSSMYGYRHYNTCESAKSGHLDTSRLAGSQSESVINTNNTCRGDEVKQHIVRATIRACAQLHQYTKAVALEEEAMFPHHCSFFRLRTNVYSGDWVSTNYSAAIYTQEYTAAHKGYCTTTIPSLTGIHGLFCVAPVYCYERFYYRQRESYPQRYIFVFLSTVNSLFIFCTHSGKPYIYTSPHYSTSQHYSSKFHCSSNDKETAITLLPYYLPVTIAHNIPITFISTPEVL